MTARGTDVVVVGAGPAGCSAAITLRRAGVAVTIVERSRGSPNRFCGEFMAGEIRDSLAELGMIEAIAALGPTRIRRLAIWNSSGGGCELKLPIEGFGLTRRSLDAALLGRAEQLGACVLRGTAVSGITGDPQAGYTIDISDESRAANAVLRARMVIGACGKRSSLDRLLGRQFLFQSTKLVGVKLHYRGVTRGELVSLFLFPDGYCGALSVEGGLATLCLLARQRALLRCAGPTQLIAAACRANAALAAWLDRATAVPGSLMTIGQIPFSSKEPVVGGVFMAGDSAGVTAPVLGLGVANALHAGIASARCVAEIVQGKKEYAEARAEYEAWWRRHCAAVQRWGHLISEIFYRPALATVAIELLKGIPSLGERIYVASRGERANHLRGLPDAVTTLEADLTATQQTH